MKKYKFINGETIVKAEQFTEKMADCWYNPKNNKIYKKKKNEDFVPVMKNIADSGYYKDVMIKGKAYVVYKGKYKFLYTKDWFESHYKEI